MTRMRRILRGSTKEKSAEIRCIRVIRAPIDENLSIPASRSGIGCMF
jgi:hypothetical protein